MRAIDLRDELEQYREFLRKRDITDASYLVREAFLSGGGDNIEIDSKTIKKSWTEFSRSGGDIKFYSHIPYCFRKCHYCCYPSEVITDLSETDRYLQDLQEYFRFFSPTFKRTRFKDLHIGGGTPSILDVRRMEKFLSGIFKFFKFEDGCRMAVEFHPTSSSHEKLMVMREFGFNHISFGVQSFDRETLKANNRFDQSVKAVRESVLDAKRVGFETVNVDLLYGLHGDDAGKLTDSFRKAVEIGPDKICLYSVQPTDHYLSKVCRTGKKEFFESRKEMLKLAKDDMFGLADVGGYDYSVAMSATSGGESNGIISFQKKGGLQRDLADPDEKAWSVFGIGLYTFSNIHDKLDYRMGRPLDPDPEKYLFSGNHRYPGRNVLRHIYTKLNFGAAVPFSEYKDKFGREFLTEFQEPVSKLVRMGVATVDDEKMSLSVGDDEWLPYFLFFVGRDAVAVAEKRYGQRS